MWTPVGQCWCAWLKLQTFLFFGGPLLYLYTPRLRRGHLPQIKPDSQINRSQPERVLGKHMGTMQDMKWW